MNANAKTVLIAGACSILSVMGYAIIDRDQAPQAEPTPESPSPTTEVQGKPPEEVQGNSQDVVEPPSLPEPTVPAFPPAVEKSIASAANYLDACSGGVSITYGELRDQGRARAAEIDEALVELAVQRSTSEASRTRLFLSTLRNLTRECASLAAADMEVGALKSMYGEEDLNTVLGRLTEAAQTRVKAVVERQESAQRFVRTTAETLLTLIESSQDTLPPQAEMLKPHLRVLRSA